VPILRIAASAREVVVVNRPQLATRRVLGLTIREHIGGRWAIPWLVALIGFPLNMAATVATNSSPASSVDAIQWTVVALVGYAAMVGALAVARLTVLRSCAVHAAPIWVVGLVGSVAGISRVLAMDAMLEVYDYTAPVASTLTVRMLASALIGFIVLPLGAFVTSTVYQFRTQRRALINDEVTWHQAQMRSEGASAEMRAALIAKIEGELSEAIGDHHQQVESTHERLQRTGRELWDVEPQRSAAAFSWRQVLAAGLQNNPLPTGLVVAIWAPTALMNFAAYQSWWLALFRIVASCAAIALVFHLGHRWMRRHGSPSGRLLLAVLAGSWFMTSPVSWWLFTAEPFSEAFPTMVVNGLWLAMVTIFSGTAIAAVQSSEAILAELRRKVSEAEIQAVAADEELAMVRRELAEQLHGPVRSRLNAASAALQGVGGADEARVGAALQDALQSLSAADQSAASSVDLHAEISRVLDPWQPLLDLEVSCPPMRTERAGVAAVLIEEAVANAYRHGRASSVQVTVDAHASALVIEVSDNGRGLPAEVEPGLGTSLLNHHAPDGWSRVSDPEQGARIRAALPLDG
jgi:signal transduction histidine kinase